MRGATLPRPAVPRLPLLRARRRSRRPPAAPGPCNATAHAVAAANRLRPAPRARCVAAAAWPRCPAAGDRPGRAESCLRLGLEPVIAALVELTGELAVAGFHDAASGQHVDT